MKHLSLLGWLLLVLVLGATLSCTDHLDQPALRFRLKTVTYSSTPPSSLSLSAINPTATRTLFYGDNNRLVSYRTEGDIFAPDSLRSKRIDYKGDFVSKLTGFVTRTEYYNTYYTYDTQNRISRIEYYTNRGFLSIRNLKVSYTFTYDGNSPFPTGRIGNVFGSANPYQATSRFQPYTFSGGNAKTINGQTYTYDTNPNPYKGLFGFSYFDNATSTPDDFNFNRDFSISEEFSDSSVKVFNQNNCTTDAQLTYNSNGLVTKIVYKDGKSEAFTYESY